VLAAYLGTDDPLERMRSHWDQEPARCPGCGETLAVPAVWAAPLP
jgi:hypothetical protein